MLVWLFSSGWCFPWLFVYGDFDWCLIVLLMVAIQVFDLVYGWFCFELNCGMLGFVYLFVCFDGGFAGVCVGLIICILVMDLLL